MSGRFLVSVATAIGFACTTAMPSSIASDQKRRGDAARSAGNYPVAARHYREGLEQLSDDRALDKLRLDLLYGLGATTLDSNEGAAAYARALAILERWGLSPADRADLMMGLGARLRGAGRCDEAKDVLEEAISLEAGSRQTADPGLFLNLGNVHRDCGDLAQARNFYGQALARDAPPWLRASVLHGLASVELLEGNLEEANFKIERSLEEGEVELGPNHPRLVRTLDLQSCVLRLLGREGEARVAADRGDVIARANPVWFQHPSSRAPTRRLTSRCS